MPGVRFLVAAHNQFCADGRQHGNLQDGRTVATELVTAVDTLTDRLRLGYRYIEAVTVVVLAFAELNNEAALTKICWMYSDNVPSVLTS